MSPAKEPTIIGGWEVCLIEDEIYVYTSLCHIIAIQKSHDPNAMSSLAKSLQRACLYIRYSNANFDIISLIFVP